ncbi:hypothetical protein ADUPG1_006497, partial [Aduncisulcus paluster]
MDEKAHDDFDDHFDYELFQSLFEMTFQSSESKIGHVIEHFLSAMSTAALLGPSLITSLDLRPMQFTHQQIREGIIPLLRSFPNLERLKINCKPENSFHHIIGICDIYLFLLDRLEEGQSSLGLDIKRTFGFDFTRGKIPQIIDREIDLSKIGDVTSFFDPENIKLSQDGSPCDLKYIRYIISTIRRIFIGRSVRRRAQATVRPRKRAVGRDSLQQSSESLSQRSSNNRTRQRRGLSMSTMSPPNIVQSAHGSEHIHQLELIEQEREREGEWERARGRGRARGLSVASVDLVPKEEIGENNVVPIERSSSESILPSSPRTFPLGGIPPSSSFSFSPHFNPQMSPPKFSQDIDNQHLEIISKEEEEREEEEKEETDRHGIHIPSEPSILSSSSSDSSSSSITPLHDIIFLLQCIFYHCDVYIDTNQTIQRKNFLLLANRMTERAQGYCESFGKLRMPDPRAQAIEDLQCFVEHVAYVSYFSYEQFHTHHSSSSGSSSSSPTSYTYIDHSMCPISGLLLQLLIPIYEYTRVGELEFFGNNITTSSHCVSIIRTLFRHGSHSPHSNLLSIIKKITIHANMNSHETLECIRECVQCFPNIEQAFGVTLSDSDSSRFRFRSDLKVRANLKYLETVARSVNESIGCIPYDRFECESQRSRSLRRLKRRDERGWKDNEWGSEGEEEEGGRKEGGRKEGRGEKERKGLTHSHCSHNRCPI